MKNLYAFLALLLISLGYSQGENNKWYFGDKAAVDFSAAPPTALFDSQMNQHEGVASISDNTGQLLFYTDGQTVWHRQHAAMTNGTGLAGTSSTEQVMIVPHPGFPYRYYIFTTAQAVSGSNPCAYTVVDMSLGSLGTNGLPLGTVVNSEKNIPLEDEFGNSLPYHTEGVTCTPRDDDSSYWILVPNGNNLYAYSLDYTGFSNTPVTSAIVGTSPLFTSVIDGYCSVKCSPRLPSSMGLSYSNLVAVAVWNTVGANGYRIFSFDDSSGLLTSNYLGSVTAYGPYAVDFTTDGRLLYASSRDTGVLYLLDLFNSNPSTNNRHVLTTSGSDVGQLTSAVQRAASGKIYLSITDSSYLSEIQNADTYSTAVVNLNAIDLIASGQPRMGKCQMGLPQLVPILHESECLDYITLYGPEAYNNYTYQVSNTITANSNYAVNSGKNITLKAEVGINLQSNTHIASGATFLAHIQACDGLFSRPFSNGDARAVYRFDLGIFTADVEISPNPATAHTVVSSNGDTLKNIRVFAIDGRCVFTQNSIRSKEYLLDTNSWQKGIYIVHTETADGLQSSRKLIVK